MTKRQLARKPRDTAERNLRLVPPPKPRRRRKLRFKWNVRALKAKYPPELLRFEEDVVLRVVRDMGGRASVRQIMDRHPERFREKGLWWTLLRLASTDRLGYTARLGLINRIGRGSIWSGFGDKPWFERYRHVHRDCEFFVK
jgi:hypothetical protein